MEEMGGLVGWLGSRGVKVVQCSNQSAEGRDLLMGGKKCKGRQKMVEGGDWGLLLRGRWVQGGMPC